MTDRFNYMAGSIKESKDINVLSIDELQSSLIVHEQKFQKHSGEEQALKMTSEDWFYSRGQGRRAPREGGKGRGCYAFNKTILETILEKSTSKQIWDSMKRKYEGNTRVKRSILQKLRTEFETLEMKTGENIINYFAKVMTIANKMRIYGEQIQDVTIVEKIIRSLTDRFNYIVCSIEESKDIDVLSIDELQSSLIIYEQKFQKHSMEEQALKVTFEDRFYGRGQDRQAPKGGGR